MRRIHPLQSCVMFLSLTETLFTSKLVFILQRFFYHILLKTVSKGTWKTCRHGVGAGREKSPSLTIRIDNIAEQIIVIYIWEIDGERFHIFGKSNFFDPCWGSIQQNFSRRIYLKMEHFYCLVPRGENCFCSWPPTWPPDITCKPLLMIQTFCHFPPLLLLKSICRYLAFPGQVHWWILNDT